MTAADLLLDPPSAGRREFDPDDDLPARDPWPAPFNESHAMPADARCEGPLVVEADQIILKAGDAMLILNRANGGTLEIRAPHVVIRGDDVTSEAKHTNMLAGHSVVTEAVVHADVLGKLIRINGQCVKINC